MKSPQRKQRRIFRSVLDYNPYVGRIINGFFLNLNIRQTYIVHVRDVTFLVADCFLSRVRATIAYVSKQQLCIDASLVVLFEVNPPHYIAFRRALI